MCGQLQFCTGWARQIPNGARAGQSVGCSNPVAIRDAAEKLPVTSPVKKSNQSTSGCWKAAAPGPGYSSYVTSSTWIWDSGKENARASYFFGRATPAACTKSRQCRTCACSRSPNGLGEVTNARCDVPLALVSDTKRAWKKDVPPYATNAAGRLNSPNSASAARVESTPLCTMPRMPIVAATSTNMSRSSM